MKRLFAYLATAALVVLGLMFSALLFALIIVAGVAAWGYFWWKSRALRRQMREQSAMFGERASSGEVAEGEVIRGEVIEGEVIRRVVTTQRIER